MHERLKKCCGGNVAAKGCTKTLTDKSVLNIRIGLPIENFGHLRLCEKIRGENSTYCSVRELQVKKAILRP